MCDEKKKNRPGCYIPKRYILAFLGFSGMFNLYTMRVNLSVAMVAMVNNSESAVFSNETDGSIECTLLREQEEETSEARTKGQRYNWDMKTQGMLLGAFFYGYIITQIPGGYMSGKFGAKWLFGGGVLVTSILTLLTPLSAGLGTYVFMAVRILEGLGEGVTFPSIIFLVSQWSPLLERSRMSTIVFLGTTLGSVLSMPITAWLSQSDVFGGWPSSFYFFGTMGCVWFVFWAFLVHESPSVHPTILKEELDYILLNNDNGRQKKAPVPWKSIFTSMPMWAIILAHFGHTFGFDLYLIELPTYLSQILHFNLKKNGLFSALPFIMQFLVASFASYTSDKLRSSGKVRITWIRKIMNSIGFIGPAVALFCVTRSGCRSELVLGFLIFGMALNGFTFSGFKATHVDMSPQFSGTLYGITNTFANLCGAIVPAIVGAVTSEGVNSSNWNKVFYIASGVYIGTAIFYVIFASAERQPWARGVKQKEMEEMSTMKENSAVITKDS